MTVPDVAPGVSVVVLSWNTRELTLACLGSLYAEQPRFTREVLVVDNGSDDGSADAVASEFPQVRLLRNQSNRGYAVANNQGTKSATGRYLCLLNSDTEVRSRALDLLVEYLRKHPDYGAAAPKLLNTDGSVQTACMNFPTLASALCFDSFWGSFPPGSWVQKRYCMGRFDHLHSRDVVQPPGSCFLMAREEFLDLGGLDEDLFLFFNDVDLCKRLHDRGRPIRYVAEAEVVHCAGASTKRYRKFLVTWHRNRLHFYRKHYGPMVVPYMRFVVRLRALEEWLRIGRRERDPTRRRAERAFLRHSLQEVLAP